MPNHDIIVVGASAGGVEVLCQLFKELPSDPPAAIFIVLHVPAHGTSVLPSIINRCLKKSHQKTSLQAIHPQDGDAIEHSKIYVAPPDHHLLLKNGFIHLARGPKENSHRPAVDPLFRTAARIYGQRVVGVVLSGTLDDGSVGLLAIKQQGGMAIVQDPDEALYSGMPRSAIDNVNVDHILPVSKIAQLLVELANKPLEEEGNDPVSSDMEMEADIAELELGAMQSAERPGKPSAFGCPECGGVLWELDEGQLIRFRCRTGHAYSTGSLMAEQSEALEEALWNALRALEEKAALAQRMAQRAKVNAQPLSAKRFHKHSQDAQQRATLVRQLLLKGEANSELSTINGHLVGRQNPAPELDSVIETTEDLGRSQTPKKNNCDFKVVALCASMGGINALTTILSSLDADFAAAITIVQHLHPRNPSVLAQLLSRHTVLQVKEAEQGDVLSPKTIYVAPPNYHLLVNPDGTISLSQSKLVHFSRPSADLLLESLAASFKQQAIAVILTGKDGDGAMGIRAIKQMGGTTIAQDQSSSEAFDMPAAAIKTGCIDTVLPLNQIGAALVKLVTNFEQDEQIGSEPRRI